MLSIHPIRTDADYEAALMMIEELFDAGSGTPQGDTLDVLTILVADYESRCDPIPFPDPIEAILYHMESRGLSREELKAYIGSRDQVDEVLDRKCLLTIDMIRKLHLGLGIAADVLIQPYSVTKVAA